MLGLLHRVLLKIPPEAAHHCVIFLLRCLQWIRFKLFRRAILKSGGITVGSIPGLTFRSRVGLAAGFDKNAEVFAALAHLGLGFIEVGTVTPKRQEGNPKPRIFRFPNRVLVNKMGFNNCGLDDFRRNILRYRRFVPGVPIFANIGKNKVTPNEKAASDYALAFGHLEDSVDGFVVNVSSPNTPGLRSLQTGEFLETIARVAPEGKPVLVKLAPDLSDEELTALCTLVGKDPRFSGIVLTNTSRQLAESLCGAAEGGLSGTPLLSRAVECVRIARPLLPGKLLIGVGGIVDIEGARKMRQAGADLVEIYTGFVYRGPALIKELAGV